MLRPSPLFEAFAAGKRSVHGKLLVSGIPRMTRPRLRNDRYTGFTVVDPGGNWSRINKDAKEPEAQTKLAKAMEVACGLTLMLAFAAGCTSAADSGGRSAQPPEPEYPAAQAWALEDGTLTEAEHRSAADGFVSCIRNSGYTTSDPVASPVDGLTLLYEFTFSGDPDVWNTKMEECNTGHV